MTSLSYARQLRQPLDCSTTALLSAAVMGDSAQAFAQEDDGPDQGWYPALAVPAPWRFRVETVLKGHRRAVLIEAARTKPGGLSGSSRSNPSWSTPPPTGRCFASARRELSRGQRRSPMSSFGNSGSGNLRIVGTAVGGRAQKPGPAVQPGQYEGEESRKTTSLTPAQAPNTAGDPAVNYLHDKWAWSAGCWPVPTMFTRHHKPYPRSLSERRIWPWPMKDIMVNTTRPIGHIRLAREISSRKSAVRQRR